MSVEQQQKLEDVLGALEKVKGPDSQGWHTGLCPFHEDQVPSFRVGDHGYYCHGCGAKGSLRELARKLGISAEPADSRPRGLTISQLAEAKRLPQALLESLGIRDGVVGAGPNRRPCVDIPYMNRSGEIVAVQKRLSLSGQPRFIWRRGDKPVPYGLWKMEEARRAGYVVIVEGASDCWTLWHHGIPALGLPGSNTWQSRYGQLLQGITPYLWVEPDEGGKTLLRGIGMDIPSVRVVWAPPDAKDPSALHLMDPGSCHKRVMQLITSAKPIEDLQREALSAQVTTLEN